SLHKRADEILASIDLPPMHGWRMTYQKLRRRGSFDFPILGVAAAIKLSGGLVEDIRLVLGAVGSSPVDQSRLAQPLIGQKPTREALQAVGPAPDKGARAHANNHPTHAPPTRIGRGNVLRGPARGQRDPPARGAT